MKAVDYYNKYFSVIEEVNTNDEGLKVARNIYSEFCDEAVSIIKARRCKTDEAIIAVFKEQNQKWNALVKIFDDKNHNSNISLVRNGFKNLLIAKNPVYIAYKDKI